MSVDLGSEWMKVAIVKPGVPMEIALNKYETYKTKFFGHEDFYLPCSSCLFKNSVILFVCSVFLFRESRRKTPVAVCLKENERLFEDSAMGVVSAFSGGFWIAFPNLNPVLRV